MEDGAKEGELSSPIEGDNGIVTRGGIAEVEMQPIDTTDVSLIVCDDQGAGVAATAASDPNINDERLKLLAKDPFNGLPLSWRQIFVFPVFVVRQFWAISFQFWFAIYARGEDPKAIGLSAMFLGWLCCSQAIVGFGDTLGRLVVYRWALVLQLICTILIVLVPYKQSSFIALCFVVGVGFGPCASLQTFIWNEALPLRMMNVTTNIMFGFWSVAIPTVLYFWRWLRHAYTGSIDHWRIGMAVTSSYLVLHLISTTLLSSSVPWHLSMRHVKRAEMSFVSLAHSRANKSEFQNLLKHLPEAGGKKTKSTNGCSGHCKQYWSNVRSLCSTVYSGTLVAGVMQFAISGLAYWGMGVQVAKFLPSAGENLELTLTLFGFLELPASIIAWWFPRKFGIAKTIAMLYLVETVFFAGLFLSGGYGLAALLLARVICSALYNLLFTLCTAGFPPEVRSTGGGMLPNVGRLGSMCAPLLGYLDTKMVVWISIISSCLGFIVCKAFVSSLPGKYTPADQNESP